MYYIHFIKSLKPNVILQQKKTKKKETRKSNPLTATPHIYIYSIYNIQTFGFKTKTLNQVFI